MSSNATSASPAAIGTSNTQSPNFLVGYLNRVRSGDIGKLPIIIGAVLIAVIGQALNYHF